MTMSRKTRYLITKSGATAHPFGLYKKSALWLFRRKWEMIPQFFPTIEEAMNHVYLTDPEAYIRISVCNGTSLHGELRKRR